MSQENCCFFAMKHRCPTSSYIPDLLVCILADLWEPSNEQQHKAHVHTCCLCFIDKPKRSNRICNVKLPLQSIDPYSPWCFRLLKPKNKHPRNPQNNFGFGISYGKGEPWTEYEAQHSPNINDPVCFACLHIHSSTIFFTYVMCHLWQTFSGMRSLEGKVSSRLSSMTLFMDSIQLASKSPQRAITGWNSPWWTGKSLKKWLGQCRRPLQL